MPMTASSVGRRTVSRLDVGGLQVITLSSGSDVENCGNVFADLGFPNSEQELVKAKLTVQIYQILRDRKVTQSEVARLLGTSQAQVSVLMRCRPVSVSVGNLMEFLTLLGQDVEVTVRPAAGAGVGPMLVVSHVG